MKQSKSLAAEEAAKATSMTPTVGPTGKYIQSDNGSYYVYPIQCTGDYVAIAPFRHDNVTKGGIVVPEEANSQPDTGIVVGVGENVGIIKPGQHVKFIPRHKAADLTGEYPFYKDVEIAVYKAASVVAILPPLPVLSAGECSA